MENILVATEIRSFFPEAGPISLSLAPGDCFHLQGSEKSCNALFEILTGLKKPDEGTVTILGQDIYTLESPQRAAFRRDHLGAIPKGSGFLPELTVLEQIKYPMLLAGLSREEITMRIQKNTLSYLPIHALYNPAKRCSQRTLALAGILRARVMAPSILILNAPFDHLNQKDGELVWQQIQNILDAKIAFLYLSSAPTPRDILWNKTMQLSRR